VIQLVLLGDVMLGRLVNSWLRKAPPEHPWGDTLSVLARADWRFCNLECALSDRGRPWQRTPKIFHFRSDTKNVAVLQAAGIDAVSIANNHTLDFDYDGLEDTLVTLDEAAIARAGAGRREAEAAGPAVLTANGIRVGLVAFTDNEPAWAARPDKPGIHYVPADPADARGRAFLDHVRKAKKHLDLLIVSAHWGGNWGDRPPAEHIAFGRALVEHGADVVYGHSCHVTRAVELVDHRAVLYSTGDFIDDYAVDPVERNDRSFIFIVLWEDDGVQGLRLYPTVTRRGQARLATGDEAERSAQRMVALCTERDTLACWMATAGCVAINPRK
jgi:poly-gamma-glutamate capsule biosynthesis protein CapA/YwtB (metallophosphatase superfamily)